MNLFSTNRRAYLALFFFGLASAFSLAFFSAQPLHLHADNMNLNQNIQLYDIKTQDENKRWVCPMHSQILQDHPGSCPICGMDLVEVANGQSEHSAGIYVDGRTQQLLGVKIVSAEMRSMSNELNTYGTIALDEASIINVVPKVEGWIRKLHVTSIGQHVRAGQVLYEIYSPELVQQQREYLELLQRRDQMLQTMGQIIGQADLAASLARERLRVREKFVYADMDDISLTQLETYRRPLNIVPVRATRAGVVTQLNVREGSYVTPGTSAITFANTQRIWINFGLYPDQSEWVKEGDTVTVKMPGSAGQLIRGRLQFVTPVADSAVQTIPARIVVDNPGLSLRPGVFVDVVVVSNAHEALTVPRSAIIHTGKGDKVMLSQGEGHFVPIPVEVGLESGEFAEIIDGLQQGGEVAANGQFMLDAAASLNEAAQRM